MRALVTKVSHHHADREAVLAAPPERERPQQILRERPTPGRRSDPGEPATPTGGARIPRDCGLTTRRSRSTDARLRRRGWYLKGGTVRFHPSLCAEICPDETGYQTSCNVLVFSILA